MAGKRSAGLLPYRVRDGRVEMFLVHPGGPFWARKDDGAWSIPKGEYDEGEDPLEVAKREFAEETALEPGSGFLHLGEVKQPGGKIVTAWAFEGTYDPSEVRSNTFELEWPKGSGKKRQFPEIDRADWFTYESAKRKILKGQVPIIEALRCALERVGLRVRDTTHMLGI